MASVSLEALLLWVAILAGISLTRLPYEELPGSGGGLVPSVLFRDQPAAFYAFVLALVLSASAAASAIMHRRGFPGYARLCRRVASASMVAASGALLYVSSRSAWIMWQSDTAASCFGGTKFPRRSKVHSWVENAISKSITEKFYIRTHLY
ncbi:unnamed protein product [Musa acuminata subsp. burmannicoides]